MSPEGAWGSVRGTQRCRPPAGREEETAIGGAGLDLGTGPAPARDRPGPGSGRGKELWPHHLAVTESWIAEISGMSQTGPR